MGFWLILMVLSHSQTISILPLLKLWRVAHNCVSQHWNVEEDLL